MWPSTKKCRSQLPIFSWFSDFALYLKLYLIDECHTFGLMNQCNATFNLKINLDDLHFKVQWFSYFIFCSEKHFSFIGKEQFRRAMMSCNSSYFIFKSGKFQNTEKLYFFSLWSALLNQHCSVYSLLMILNLYSNMTFWGFMASHQDCFTLLSHGKQVDAEQKRKFSIWNHLTICKLNVAFPQAVWMGFKPAQIQQRKTN